MCASAKSTLFSESSAYSEPPALPSEPLGPCGDLYSATASMYCYSSLAIATWMIRLSMTNSMR